MTFLEPASSVSLPAPDVPAWLRPWRLKEWHYHSLVCEEWLLAFAVARLGYLASAFAYLVDRKTGRKQEYETLLPLGRGVQFAPGSAAGATTLRAKDAEMVLEAFDGGWRCSLTLPFLQGSAVIERDEPVVLRRELAPGRMAYTHKQAGNRCFGSFGGVAFPEGRSFATLDWTRAYPPRRTEWSWLSVAGRAADGRRAGLNLSARIYGAEENYLWVDGEPTALGAVAFEPGPRLWRVRGECVDLSFAVRGERRQDVNLGVVRSCFVQPYGTCSGTVGSMELREIFGVVEDHAAIW